MSKKNQQRSDADTVTYFANPAFWTRSPHLQTRYYSEQIQSVLRHPSAQDWDEGHVLAAFKTRTQLLAWVTGYRKG